MESKLVAHLSRCDANALIDQLGERTLALLKKVGEDAVVPKGLAELTVHVFGEDGVLKVAALRKLIFDKLEPEEGAHLCRVLGLPDVAPSMTLNGAEFDNDQSNARLLRGYFNVTSDDEEVPIEGTQNAVAAHQLRTHQAEAYRKLRRAIGDPSASALVHMPFGAGKLRAVATAVLDLYRAEPDGRIVLWLAAGPALCDEVFAELNKVWHQLGSRNVTAYRLFGSHPKLDLANIRNGLVVADVSWLDASDVGLAEFAQRTRVVVLGDAESLRHSEVSELLETMDRDGGFSLIGVSASPADTIEKLSALTPISARFAGNSISIEDSDPIGLLRSAGEIDEIVARIETLSGLATGDLPRVGSEIATEALTMLSRDVDRNHAIIEFVLDQSKQLAESLVVYCASAEQARLFAGLFLLRGTRATAISSEMSDAQKHNALQRYLTRSDKILCVHDCFITGTDFPDSSMIVIAVPLVSSSVLNEVVGRLASGRSKPTDPLQVVLLADAVPDYLALAEGIGNWNELKI